MGDQCFGGNVSCAVGQKIDITYMGQVIQIMWWGNGEQIGGSSWKVFWDLFSSEVRGIWTGGLSCIDLWVWSRWGWSWWYQQRVSCVFPSSKIKWIRILAVLVCFKIKQKGRVFEEKNTNELERLFIFTWVFICLLMSWWLVYGLQLWDWNSYHDHCCLFYLRWVK